MNYLKNYRSLARCSTVPLSCEENKLVALIPKTPAKLKPTSSVLSPQSLINALPKHHLSSSTVGIAVPLHVRFAHTDVTKVPDFTTYRASETQDPTCRSADSDIKRKAFVYTMMFAGGVLATTAAKYTVKTAIMPLGPSAATLAEATVEVNLDAIPEGKNITIKWRNKPLFIRHRSAEEIARERAVPLASLRHPERDEDRVKEDKWLICLGVCTHLGCIPIAHAGDYEGGYYCPCHGSHYDGSGRIRKGPAPLNLEVPEYKFLNSSTVIVG